MYMCVIYYTCVYIILAFIQRAHTRNMTPGQAQLDSMIVRNHAKRTTERFMVLISKEQCQLFIFLKVAAREIAFFEVAHGSSKKQMVEQPSSSYSW